MDSEVIIHFSFFFYALMKGRIATISFGCLCAVEERRNHRVYDMSGFSYDITDVVHLLQLRVRHKNSSSMDVNCPFCGETKGKMNVNLQKNVFRCNRCDASGGCYFDKNSEMPQCHENSFPECFIRSGKHSYLCVCPTFCLPSERLFLTALLL